jgi:hypothetical protein
MVTVCNVRMYVAPVPMFMNFRTAVTCQLMAQTA